MVDIFLIKKNKYDITFRYPKGLNAWIKKKEYKLFKIYYQTFFDKLLGISREAIMEVLYF